MVHKISLYPGGGAWEKQRVDDMRSRLFNSNDEYSQKTDLGIANKNTLNNDSGFGGNSRPTNQFVGVSARETDEDNKIDGLTSGNDGGQADDEIGPGNTSVSPNPYYPVNVGHELFLDLNLNNKDGKIDKSRIHLNKILNNRPSLQ